MKTSWKIGLTVAGVVIVLLVVAGILLSARMNEAEAPPSVSSEAPSSSQSQPASSSSSSSEEKAKTPPAAAGPYDVEGLPPLFNYENEIPAGHAMDLTDVGGGQQMDRPAAEAFLAMHAAAAQDGVDLAPISGYRSHETQTNNYNASVQNYLSQGYDEAEAIRLTGRYYARPGTSEHEVGLAMDIGVVDDSFANTPAFAWLQEHCKDYGFIFRYRQETEEITRIAYEPWHYRFVGANHANEIEKLGITLEEYRGLYEA